MNELHTQQMREDIAAVEAAMQELLPYEEATRRQIRVLDAMHYSLEAGGKRIRPVLVQEFCRLCGGDPQKAKSAACAIEMIHTFSLIHDDLPAMDDDDYRRGRKSCHKAFDEATAILAGDALSVQAFTVLAGDPQLDAETKIRLIALLSDATGHRGMIGGQVIDMENETRTDVRLEDLKAMYAAKTGALIRVACLMGAVVAGADEETLQKAAQYADCLGLAFQIVDDILDVTSTTEVLGKPVGSDSASNKTTFVTLLSVEEAQHQAAALTQEALAILDTFADSAFLKELTQELLIREK